MFAACVTQISTAELEGPSFLNLNSASLSASVDEGLVPVTRLLLLGYSAQAPFLCCLTPNACKDCLARLVKVAIVVSIYPQHLLLKDPNRLV